MLALYMYRKTLKSQRKSGNISKNMSGCVLYDVEVATSWMDLVEIPITSRTQDNGRDLPESVATIHKLIDDLIHEGLPANRIVLGGFSQGAALALAATLKYCELVRLCGPHLIKNKIEGQFNRKL